MYYRHSVRLYFCSFFLQTQGNIRVNNAKAIDRETTPFYRLIVTATDNAFPDTYRRMVR